MEENKELTLFTTFFKIGAFTFGGGYAMIPMIQREIVDKRHWIDADEILDIIAIAESTPGPIAVNSATFVGAKIAGKKGAFMATLGVVLPSFLIILLIAHILNAFETNRFVSYAFTGIRAGVMALILNAAISMYKQCSKDVVSIILMIASMVLVAFFNFNAIAVLLMCAAVGLATSWRTQKGGN
jgi:chromate transporter